MKKNKVPEVIPDSCDKCDYWQQKKSFLNRYGGHCSFYDTETYYGGRCLATIPDYSEKQVTKEDSISTMDKSPVESITTSEQLKTPTSVSVISWLLILFSAIGVIVILVANASVSTAYNVKINPLAITFVIIAAILQAIMGIGMLGGQNWARLLFLWLTPVSIIIGFLGENVSPLVIAKIFWYFIFAIMLTRPHVTQYFHSSSTSADYAINGTGEIEE